MLSTVECGAAVAQLGERQTEDLKVPGSIPGLGSFYFIFPFHQIICFLFFHLF